MNKELLNLKLAG